MKNIFPRYFHIYITIGLFILQAISLHGNNIRMISSKDGLSNNAVLYITQMSNNHLLLGTCDGLNIWNGKKMTQHTLTREKIAGNMIDMIIPWGSDRYWIKTNFGAALIDEDSVIETHGQFKGIYRICSDSKKHCIIYTPEDMMYHYSIRHRRFTPISWPKEISYTNIINICIFDDSLLIFTKDGIYSSSLIQDPDTDEYLKTSRPVLIHNISINRTNINQDESGKIPVLSREGILYLFDMKTSGLEYKANISENIARHGQVSHIMRCDDDFFISFLLDGVIHLKYRPETRLKYDIHRLNIDCGVFCLFKDRFQDIIWAGSDGKGLVMQSNDEDAFTSFCFDKAPFNIQKPIRSLMIDRNRTLWIGTKGAGILRIHDFDPQKTVDNISTPEYFNNESDGLSENEIYSIYESGDIIWIGGGHSALRWYSHKDKKIHRLQGDLNNIKFITKIHASNPNTLWITTMGYGVYRLDLDLSNGRPTVKECRKLEFSDTFNTSYFFSMYPDSDGTIWFGNRGGGLIHYFPDSHSYSTYSMSHISEIANDIWTITRSHEDGELYIGTSAGLLYMNDKHEVKRTPIKELVHEISSDQRGNLYLSTNSGILKYRNEHQQIVKYGWSQGISILEYCDGAVYNDSSNKRILFGGINGFVAIDKTEYIPERYYPELNILKLNLDSQVLHERDIKDRQIVIEAGQHLRSIEISAIDFLYGDSYTYEYRINDSEWIRTSEEIILGNILPGRYTIEIRYRNHRGETSQAKKLEFKVKPPLYSSTGAKILYIIILLAIATAITVANVKIKARKQERAFEILQRTQKEEEHHVRMNVLNMIAQQMSKPISMILMPAQQILEYGKTNIKITELGNKILKQGEKLKGILHLLHNYSRSDENDVEQTVSIFSVNRVLDEIINSYSDVSRNRNILFTSDVQTNLIWSSNQQAIITVMEMLISTAISHLKDRGKIHLMVSIENDMLAIDMTSSGYWMTGSDFERITNRFDALIHFIELSRSGTSFNNEMRIAICYNIVARLGGAFRYTNTDESHSYNIRLPYMSSGISVTSGENVNIASAAPHEPEPTLPVIDIGKRWHMAITGSNMELVSYINDLFSSEYHTHIYDNPVTLLKDMKKTHPDIIILENINLRKDIADTLKTLREDSLTVKTPVILITDINHSDASSEQYADTCIELPFNAKKLQKAATQLLDRIESLKKYYNSNVSIYEFSNGRKLHQDDKNFLERIFGIIRENITDTSLNTQFIADSLGMTTRNLYYRLEELTDITPHNIIKEYRLSYAEILLKRTKLSIDEILLKAGFTNRGTFFRNFSAKFGMTPKSYRESHN